MGIILLDALAINDHELPPKTLKSINVLNDGLSYTCGEARDILDRELIQKLLESVNNGDMVDYDLFGSNNQRAKGKARINRISVGCYQSDNDERMMYAFELEPIERHCMN